MKNFIIMLVGIATAQSVCCQNVGIGTTNPSDKLHISVPAGVDPLRVDINSNTKLRVRADGGVSIGTATVPPTDGLLVQGTIQPQNNISTPNKMYIESTADSMVIKAGNSRIIIAQNGNITIETKGTSTLNIESNGNLNLKGTAVNIEAAGTLTLRGSTISQIAGANITMNAASAITQTAGANIGLNSGTISHTASAAVIINGGIVTLNGGGRPVARLADNVAGGVIASGSPTVFTN